MIFKIEIGKHLAEFLKSNNAYDAVVENIRLQNTMKLAAKINPILRMGQPFIWRRTGQGADFWIALSNRYSYRYKQYLGMDEVGTVEEITVEDE